MDRRGFLTGAATGLAVTAGAAVLAGCEKKEEKQEAKKVEAPAINKNIRELKMVTTWPKNFPGLGTGAAGLAKAITEASDGRLKVKVFAAGELVPPFESFDAVSSGKADMYHAASYYWQGKSKGFNFFTAVPMGLTADENNAWIYHGGGQELWDELAAKFNLKCLPAGNTGVQMGGWFNKEINSVEDLKGLKIRMPGLGGEVLRHLGAAAVTLPGGEIYPALQSGAIDATEWVGPWNDLAFGFYKVTKYYYWPGFHEPGSTLELGMNKDFWESLSKADQALVSACASEANNKMLAEYDARNGAALAELINKHGVKLREFPGEVQDAFRTASLEVLEKVGTEGDEMTKKIYSNFMDFRKNVKEWSKLSNGGFMKMRG